MTATPGPPASWSLRRRLGATALGTGLVLLLVVGLSAALLVQVRSRQQRVLDDYSTAVQVSQQEFIWMVDAETAVRGYALTRDPAALQPLQEATRGAMRTRTRRVEAALAADPQALRALRASRTVAARWYTDWAQPSIALVRSGGSLSASQVEDGKVLFDQLRSRFTAYLDVVAAHRRAARRQLDASTDLLFAAVVASALVAGASSLGLWVLLRRWVEVPVAGLARETRAVRAGALDHPVRGSGPRELQALAADVDAMRERLVRQVTAADAARRDLEAARADLEQRGAELARSNRDLEQFAYVASHDLQEPLRKVASFCQLLQKRYGGQLDERADQYIDFAVDGAKRMQQLISDLLAFSRVGRSGPGHEPGAPAPTADLSACLQRALGALSSAVEESGAVVTADPLPTVPGQAGLLTQLLQNLVGNAVKFRAPDRPVRVHLGARPVERDGRPSWELCCADNGIGIEQQYAERVFVIFQRLHAKEVYEGTGIGLALCKRIVEHHGGTIWVAPQEGQGTVVHWTLPAQDDAQDDAARQAPAGHRPPVGATTGGGAAEGGDGP